MPVSLSHEVAPIWREYERGTTATVDAFTKPLFDADIVPAATAFGVTDRDSRRALGEAALRMSDLLDAPEVAARIHPRTAGT